MLYRKPLNDIDLADVQKFLEQRTPENTVLDYKRTFPNDLAKSIAAMANTFGGLILVGVDEDKEEGESRPKLPIAGIPFERGLEEKVSSISIDSISPPVVPDVRVISLNDNGKAIIIIRISQSAESPHAISTNTKIYVRTGNRNSPEQLADLNRIQWLFNQRQRSVDFRKKLAKDAYRRFEYFCAPKSSSDTKHYYRYLTIVLSPTYPKAHYISPFDLFKISDEICVVDKRYGGGRFPATGEMARMIQNGIVFQNEKQIPGIYIDLSSFGLCFMRINVLAENHAPSPKTPISLATVCHYIDRGLELAMNYYGAIGFVGPLEYQVALEVDKKKLDTRHHNPRLPGGGGGLAAMKSPDPLIEFAEAVHTNSLKDDDLVVSPVEHIGWGFGMGYELKDIHELLPERWLK